MSTTNVVPTPTDPYPSYQLPNGHLYCYEVIDGVPRLRNTSVEPAPCVIQHPDWGRYQVQIWADGVIGPVFGIPDLGAEHLELIGLILNGLTFRRPHPFYQLKILDTFGEGYVYPDGRMAEGEGWVGNWDLKRQCGHWFF